MNEYTSSGRLLGAYISIRPPQNKNHWSWFIVFIVLGAFCAGISFLQNKINEMEINESRQDLNTRIMILQRNTDRLNATIKSTAKVPRARIHVQRFDVHPRVAGDNLKMNEYFQNIGDLPAEWEGYYLARVIDDPASPKESEVAENNLFADFLGRVKGQRRYPVYCQQKESVGTLMLDLR